MSSITSDLLIQQYPPVLSAAQVAEIYGQHVQTVRRLARAGRLPFHNVSISGTEKRYRLADVIAHLDNPPIAQAQKTRRGRGRPVGSKNRETTTHAPA